MQGLVHTGMPQQETGKYGEFIFAKHMVENCVEKTDFWFSKNDLKAVPEIDAILIHPEFGYFIFEIKGHSISQVIDYKDGSFKVPPKGPGLKEEIEHPKKQVLNNLYKLKEHLELNLQSEAPWINCAISFPNITREEWQEKFGLNFPCDYYFFKNDLVDINSITKAFLRYKDAPLIGAYPGNIKKIKFRNSAQSIEILNGKTPTFQVSPEEQAAIKQPKDNLREKVERFRKFNSGVIRIDGKAGTGKTLFLLEWVQQRAAEGENAVLLTFNKCLAAELKRASTSISELSDTNKGTIGIYDIYDLKRSIELTSGIADEYKKLSFEDGFLNISKDPRVEWPEFDAIAIDEGQDFYNYFLPFIEKISHVNTPWMISYSEGQRLYESEDIWVNQFVGRRMESGFEQTRLNRQFRSMKNSSLLGQAFDEHFPNLEKAKTWLQSKQSDNSPESYSLFSEPEKGINIHWRFSSELEVDIEVVLIEFLARAYNRDRGARPMVIFHSNKDESYKLIKACLEKAHVPFIDYLDGENRRTIAQPGLVRLTTIHSARGTESDDVLLVNIENTLLSSTIQKNPKMEKPLAYVAFTRQRKDLTVLVKSFEKPNQGNLTPARFIYELSKGPNLEEFTEKFGFIKRKDEENK